MKKGLLMIVMGMLLLICFVGCGDSSATLKVILAKDEYIIGEYEQQNEIGDKVLDVLKNISVTKVGYTFEGWTINGRNVNKDTAIKEKNVEVYPQFRINTYTITFMDEDRVIKTENINFKGIVNKPENPTKEGYIFKGWDKEIPEIMPAEDLVFNAVFEKNSFEITFKVDGEVIKHDRFEAGSKIEKPQAPVKEGYIFKGWDKEVPAVMPAEHLEFNAIFEKETFEITFKVDGEVIKQEQLEAGSKIEKPQAPVKEGHIFKGWDKEVPEIMPQEHLEFNAIFEAATYNIVYAYDDGHWPTTSPTTTNELLDALFTDFHEWLNSTVDLALFIKDANGLYKNGKWQDVKSKLYAANLKDIRENSEYFINDIKYHDKWIGFFNMLDKCITEVNPAQDLWSSTYVGCLRLYEICDNQNRFNDDQKNRLRESLQIEIKPKTTYQMGEQFDFMNLVLNNGREFLGWYIGDEKIEGITPSMAKDLTVTAKYSDPIFPETITINNPVSKLGKGENYELDITLLPSNITHGALVYSSSNAHVATINKGIITTLGYGSTIITISSEYKPEVKITFNLEVFPNIENDIPVIYLTWEVRDRLVIKVNEEYDLLFGVHAFDKTDGDITSKITVDDATLDPDTAGNYRITYSVQDKDGNTFEFVREVVVVGVTELIFIGHAGCYSGIMNTEEAFINAATVKGYKAIECDVKQTSDGVFVVCHDNDFGGYALASTPYSVLKDVVVTQTRGGIKYEANICTFKRYLEICKQYGVLAVVELKSSAGITNSDQSRMPALLQEIKDADMLDQVIFLGSQYKCLEWVRNNGYTNPCQYLVNSCESETIYNRCVEWNFDVSINVSYANSVEWIDRYHEAGLKVSSYTFSQYSTAELLQSWIDKGVDFVTCDVLTANDVTIPDHGNDDNVPEYQVIFKDIDGTILKTAVVKEGKKAVAPFNPTKEGYEFTGWDTDFSNVKENMIVNATYSLVNYTIKYDANFKVLEESTWSSKSEFIDEFYGDWFNWYASNVGKISGLTFDGTTYTLKVNSTSNGTAKFKNVEDLKNLDIYVVEQTIGTLVYKPIEGTNSADYVMEENNGYFLQTEPYRTKYKALNAYFLNVMQTAYTSYSKTYKPTSAGKVQIFFRFHQWQKGTSIPSFNELPKKYVVISDNSNKVTLPTIHTTYNFEDSFELEKAVCEGYTFMGWYLDQECTKPISEIIKGSTGNITLYAKWEKVTN